MREDAACDGLAHQRRPVVLGAHRWAPLGGETDPGNVARAQVLEVGLEQVGEVLGDAVVEEAEVLF